jgi:transcriptional antiterminator RfaH
MNCLRDINWFAIHTKRLRESFAATNVGALGVEVFLPRFKADWLGRERVRETAKPLFPGYFFARFCPEVFLDLVECSRGVCHVVKSGRQPIKVDDDVVGEIQARAEPDGFVRVHPPDLKPGDRVAIQSGPFEGMMGQVEHEMDDQRRVAILLETLWNARVLVERRWIEAQAA